MHRNALIARAEDRVHAVETFDGRTACPRLTLIAGRGRIVEVVAAGSLQQISAICGHIAELR
jgi:hypothetical protein